VLFQFEEWILYSIRFNSTKNGIELIAITENYAF